MKKQLLFLNVFAIILVLSLFSCKKDDVLNEESLTSLTLSSDLSQVDAGLDEKFTFEVVGNDGNDYTESAVYYIDGNQIDNNTFDPESEGTFKVTAEYNEITSNEVTVTANSNINTQYSTKILVEDYTATWCQYCPRVAYKLEEAVSNNSKIIPVAIHTDQEMKYEYESSMRSTFGVTGWPTALINRINKWNENESQFTSYLETTVGLGLGISSTKTGNDLEISVKVGFNTSYTDELKLVVYLLEDNLLYDQSNSTNYYEGAHPIVDFEHDNVLRKAYTDVMGDIIASSQTTEGNVFSKIFNVTIPNNVKNTDNLKLVAFVVKGSDNEAVNAQSAVVGESQDFD